jgi:hypothetical protein
LGNLKALKLQHPQVPEESDRTYKSTGAIGVLSTSQKENPHQCQGNGSKGGAKKQNGHKDDLILKTGQSTCHYHH